MPPHSTRTEAQLSEVPEHGWQHERRNLPPGSRGLRLTDKPTYSLVLASTGPRAGLEQWLAALEPICLRRAVEVVVARSTSAEEFRDLQKAHPGVLFMPGPDNCTARQLRGYGLAAADGDIVVLADDASPPDPEWIDAVTAPSGPGSA